MTTLPLDVDLICKDFPILSRTVRDGRRLVYLDSGATSQKPRRVLDAERDFYENHNAAVHRGAHQLAEEATDLYESARRTVAGFIGAAENEVVFTKNSTEGVNLLAYAMSNAATAGPEASRFAVGPGDEIVVTEMEHHANLLPWQQLCIRSGATLRWLTLTDDGRLDLDSLGEVINERTRVVALVHQSNILGTVNPVEAIVRRAQEVGALVLIDASQAAPHMPLDVQALQADFVAFTGHKMCGPSGAGALWGRRELLEAMEPFNLGGHMIRKVRFEETTWGELPHKFEAGTPPIAEAVGFGAAIDYLNGIGFDAILEHEHDLVAYALEQLGEIPGVTLYGPPAERRAGIVSFNVEGVHPHDVAQVLDLEGVAIRAGHHCCQPLMRKLGVAATNRASFYLYTIPEEIDRLVAGLHKVKQTLG